MLLYARMGDSFHFYAEKQTNIMFIVFTNALLCRQISVMRCFSFFLFSAPIFIFQFINNSVFAGGCDVNASITPSGPTTFCSGDSITLTANYGASYQWNNGATTQSIWVSQSGIYNVIVTDTNGCTDASGFTFVSVLPSPDATILADQLPPFCMGDTIQLFTINFFAQHQWSTGETEPYINITQSGLYSVVVTNFAGCSDTGFFPAAFLPAPFLNVSANGPTTFCEGGHVTLSVNFGFGLDFLWSPGGQTTSSITVSQTGTYNVTATNFFGCSTTSQDFNVNAVPLPSAHATGDTTLCAPDTVPLSATGGTNYSWSNGASGENILVVPTYGDNQYIVTVSNPGCNQSAKDTVFIHTGGNVVAAFSVNPQPLGDETFFTDLSSGNIVSWNWDFGNGNFSFQQNPSTVYYDEDTFTVVLIVADTFGCSDTAQQQFGIQQVVTIPNVFTPNGDGINDIFYIRNAGDGSFSFVVTNRWGKIVYESQGQEVRWNGYTNTGVMLEAGTYFYTLLIELKPGEEPILQKGFITLLKG